MKITGISVFYSFVQAKIVKLDSSFLKESFHEQEKNILLEHCLELRDGEGFCENEHVRTQEAKNSAHMPVYAFS